LQEAELEDLVTLELMQEAQMAVQAAELAV
jgi:hypothetical protein